MTAAIVIALIALAASVVSTVLTVFGTDWLRARRESRTTLDTYREPLVSACYELQSRLYNILCLHFAERYIVSDEAGKRRAAIQSTLYVFAQFFGWREIIRREVQYLRFARNSKTRKIGALLGETDQAFLSDKHGQQFMIWRAEQRGLGEQMIVAQHGKMSCLGYASFLKHRSSMKEWLDPLEHDLETLTDDGRARLTQLQHLLLELVSELDDKHKRYPSGLSRA